MFKMQDWIRSLFGKKKRSRRGAATNRQGTPAQVSQPTISAGQALTAAETRLPDAGASVPIRSTAAATKAAAVSEDDIPQEWKAGDIFLDLYEVTGLLGAGGMGQVYRVHHKGWNVDLAVKSPRPDVLAQAGGAEGFVRECETWVNLGLHPHIVSCHYVRTLGGIPRVFAEYVEGGSLSEWIGSRRLYEGGPEKALARILDIAIQFAWGLDYAHEQGLVHQDVKPANVMMTPDGTAKVTDFGLARTRAAVSEAAAAAPGVSVLVSVGGMTPAYCSPEQAAGEALSRKTDMWSWGLSVLEMFTGEVSWLAGQAAPDVLDGYLQTEADVAIARMPEAIASLLRSCFERDPEARPRAMTEIATALRATYQHATGKRHPRDEPKAAGLTAETLNNRGLSLLDLGRQAEAEAAWAAALGADPHHAATTYNRGVVLWRRAELTDEALVRQLDAVRASYGEDWESSHLLALVHMERGDTDSALPLLGEAAKQAPGGTDIDAALRLCRSEQTGLSRQPRLFEGHESYVWSVSMSDDGRWGLSGGGDEVLRLWEVATGRSLHAFPARSLVTSVCLSGDGRWALSGSEDQVLRVWEVATGRCLHALQGHSGMSMAVAFSPDARFAVSGSNDMKLKVWEVATGRCVKTFGAHMHGVKSVCLSGDGQWALSGGDDKTLRLWEVATGRCQRAFAGHTDIVTCVSLSADGRRALSASDDKALRLWDIATGQCLRIFEGHVEQVNSACLSADGSLAVSGSGFSRSYGSRIDNTVRVWEVATGRCLRTFQGHSDEVTSVSVSRNGRWALSGSADTTVRLWSLPDLSVQRRISPFRVSRVRSHADLAAAENSALKLLTRGEEGLARNEIRAALADLRQARAIPGWERAPQSLDAWARLYRSCSQVSLRGGWLSRTLEGHTARVYSACLSAGGRWALSGSADKSLRLWEVETGRCVRTFEGHEAAVDCVFLSADGREALSAGSDATLRLWDTGTGRCLRTFTALRVKSLCLSSDRRRVLAGDERGELSLWDVRTGHRLRTFRAGGQVNSVCMSLDGRWVLSGGAKLELRETATGRVLRVFERAKGSVNSVCLSADGQWVISAEGSGYDMDFEAFGMRLLEVATGRCLRRFVGHTSWVACGCLSTNARWALSGSHDGTLRLWEVASGRCLQVFAGHSQEVSAVSLSADSRWALSASHDGTLCLWELDWEVEAHDPADWDEGARPYLGAFLVRHTPFAGALDPDHEPTDEQITAALTPRGAPSWREEDFESLLLTLGCAGYGWLRPDGIRKKLTEMASQRQPPSAKPE